MIHPKLYQARLAGQPRRRNPYRGDTIAVEYAKTQRALAPRPEPKRMSISFRLGALVMR
jgi:hypothetical protein